jgi:hypothetical protein
MHPEMEPHFAVLDAVQAAYEKAVREAPQHSPGGFCPACAAIVPSQEALRAARRAAMVGAAGASDPLVRWIGSNCWEYLIEALEVLRRLPAPMAELDALASERGWCGAWQEFKDEARQAGVLPDGAPQEAAAP